MGNLNEPGYQFFFSKKKGRKMQNRDDVIFIQFKNKIGAAICCMS